MELSINMQIMPTYNEYIYIYIMDYDNEHITNYNELQLIVHFSRDSRD